MCHTLFLEEDTGLGAVLPLWLMFIHHALQRLVALRSRVPWCHHGSSHLHLLLESSHSSSRQLLTHLLCGAVREMLERYLKLSSLIISWIPQDIEVMRTDDGKTGVENLESHLSQGSRGTPRDTAGNREEVEVKFSRFDSPVQPLTGPPGQS